MGGSQCLCLSVLAFETMDDTQGKRTQEKPQAASAAIAHLRDNTATKTSNTTYNNKAHAYLRDSERRGRQYTDWLQPRRVSAGSTWRTT